MLTQPASCGRRKRGHENNIHGVHLAQTTHAAKRTISGGPRTLVRRVLDPVPFSPQTPFLVPRVSPDFSGSFLSFQLSLSLFFLVLVGLGTS